MNGPSEGELFRKVMGEQWLTLHPDIRRRFDKPKKSSGNSE